MAVGQRMNKIRRFGFLVTIRNFRRTPVENFAVTNFYTKSVDHCTKLYFDLAAKRVFSLSVGLANGIKKPDMCKSNNLGINK